MPCVSSSAAFARIPALSQSRRQHPACYIAQAQPGMRFVLLRRLAAGESERSQSELGIRPAVSSRSGTLRQPCRRNPQNEEEQDQTDSTLGLGAEACSGAGLLKNKH